MRILLIAYGIFHLGVFLALLCKRFTIIKLTNKVSETIEKFSHYYRKGNIFGKILAIIVFVTLAALTLPEIIIGRAYYPISIAKRDLKDFIERKCYPDLVEEVIYNVPHSKFQLLRDAKIPFSIGKDYVVI